MMALVLGHPRAVVGVEDILKYDRKLVWTHRSICVLKDAMTGEVLAAADIALG
jgi:hypothetical protein